MATLDNDDKKWLIDNFASKSDLKSLANKKDIKRLEDRLDEHFKYLDKDVSYFRKQTAYHLGIPVSKLIKTSG